MLSIGSLHRGGGRDSRIVLILSDNLRAVAASTCAGAPGSETGRGRSRSRTCAVSIRNGGPVWTEESGFRPPRSNSPSTARRTRSPPPTPGRNVEEERIEDNDNFRVLESVHFQIVGDTWDPVAGGESVARDGEPSGSDCKARCLRDEAARAEFQPPRPSGRPVRRPLRFTAYIGARGAMWPYSSGRDVLRGSPVSILAVPIGGTSLRALDNWHRPASTP